MTRLLTPRIATAERRNQIVAAALGLLSKTSLEALTTRELAAELGLTQPALFRHFASREALLVAVVDHARQGLADIVVRVLGEHPTAVAQLGALGRALLAHVERHPGLPRLLFAATAPTAGKLRDALRAVVSMQASLVGDLVAQGQSEGALDRTVPAASAATLFVGMLQGLVLAWDLAARREPLAERFEAMFTLWLGGVAARSEGAPDAPPPPSPVPLVPFAALDVRPILASGVDPLAAILAALATVAPAGVLVIEAPFRPAPLIARLEARGHGVHVEALAKHHWLLEVVLGGAPAIEDLRDLEPPEPLERVLRASAALQAGEVYLARLPRVPRMLLPHLRERGVHFDLSERCDGAALIRIEPRP